MLNAANPPREKMRFPPFTAPRVEEGTPVFWYPDCQRNVKPLLGEVTYVGDTLTKEPPRMIQIIVRASGNDIQKDSVMHLDDPWCADVRKRGYGAWDFRPPAQEVVELQDRVGDLESAVEKLGKGRTSDVDVAKAEHRIDLLESRMTSLESQLGVAVDEPTKAKRGKKSADGE